MNGVFNQPMHLLSNEEVYEIIKKAIKQERKFKQGKHVHKSEIITQKKFFKSKLFNKSHAI